MNTEHFDRKEHWENIYSTKSLENVSWYQPVPKTSLDFFKEFKVPRTAKVIDVGGGDSYLVDHLIEQGYEDITVLDISKAAIERAKTRLGADAQKVKWVVADASNFVPTERYDMWHDRAAFHFLTDEKEISKYVDTAAMNINPGGVLVVGTFSDQGPKKCSGIEIKQYTESSMAYRFVLHFNKVRCFTVVHPTPFDTTQNFVFCSFRKMNGNSE